MTDSSDFCKHGKRAPFCEQCAYARGFADGAERMREANAAAFDSPQTIEAMSAEAHRAYQVEAHRRGDVRHPDKYEDLSESTKEWDRVLCRWVAREIRIRALPIPEAEGKR